jgi:hypothetical protein
VCVTSHDVCCGCELFLLLGLLRVPNARICSYFAFCQPSCMPTSGLPSRMKQSNGEIHGCEWKYIGEGGKHALFESSGVGFQGKLLRIEKRLFCAASFCSSHEHRNDIERQKTSPLNYLEAYVAPQLAPYIDIPELVPIDWVFLKALRDATLAAGVVPPSRIKDWNPKFDSELDMNEEKPIGILVLDYRKIPASMVEQDALVARRQLCIEVKPKAGYLSRSPLVHPNHRVKFIKSRFSLLQVLHQQGHFEKGWAKTARGIKRSNYEPLDLFSKDRTRMNRAIESLVESPQNNLKVWYNNQDVTKKSTLDRKAMELVLEEVTSYAKSRIGERHVERAFSSLVSNLLVPVLDHESLMGKLQILQKLDILDVDGAILVSDRLVELCGGSELEAEKVLSDELQREGDQKGVHPLLAASPFHLSCEDSTIFKLCQTTERFQERMSGFGVLLPDAAVLDKFYLEARDLVLKLSIEECVFLLSNWLLSLAMCDVGIFVTFRQLRSPKEGASQRGGAIGQAETKVVIEASSNNGSGIICTTNKEGAIFRFAYIVRLIDCDQKPARKLWGRKEKEAAFAKLRMEESENNLTFF